MTFLVGVLAFGAASLLAAISTSFAVLELARVLQAVSGAFVSTGSASIIREIAPAGRRGEAFGLFDLLVSVSAAVGPFVGGVLVGAFGWRSMFYLAVPIAIGAAAAVAFLLAPRRDANVAVQAARHPGPGRPRRADRRRSWSPSAPTPPTSASGPRRADASSCWSLFVVVELRTEHPAVDPRLFRSRSFAAAVAGVFGATVVLHGALPARPAAGRAAPRRDRDRPAASCCSGSRG